MLFDIAGQHRLRSLGGMTPTQAQTRDLARQRTEAALQVESYSGHVEPRQEYA